MLNKIILINEKEKIIKAIELNDKPNELTDKDDIKNQFNKFIDSLNKDYDVKDITNNFSKKLRYSPYLGYYRYPFNYFMPSTGYRPIESNGNNISQDTETSFSNLLGVIGQLQSEKLKSPFESVSDEDWNSFLQKEFNILYEEQDELDESFKKSDKAQIIQNNQIKRELKELTKRVNILEQNKLQEESYNFENDIITMYKEMETVKKDILLIFEKLSNII